MDSVRRCANPKCNNPISHKRAEAKYCSHRCQQAKYHINMANDDHVQRSKRGAISEMVACADLLRRGYDTYRAVAAHCPCDLVAIRGDEILRVEVKTAIEYANGTNGRPHVGPDQRATWSHAAIVFRDGRVQYEPDIA